MTDRAERQKKEENSTKTQREYLYKGRIVNLRIDKILKKNPFVAEIVEHNEAVAILPIDEKKNVLLVKQYRRAANEVILEIPAGIIEPREKLIDCAQRELQEETGFFAKDLKFLFKMYSSPGFCTELIHVFLAKDLISKPLPPDHDEEIDLVTVSEKDLLKMIYTNQIIDAKTIAAILYWLNIKKNK